MDYPEEGIEAEPGDDEMDSLIRQTVHLRVDEYPEPPSPGPENAKSVAGGKLPTDLGIGPLLAV